MPRSSQYKKDYAAYSSSSRKLIGASNVSESCVSQRALLWRPIKMKKACSSAKNNAKKIPNRGSIEPKPTPKSPPPTPMPSPARTPPTSPRPSKKTMGLVASSTGNRASPKTPKNQMIPSPISPPPVRFARSSARAVDHAEESDVTDEGDDGPTSI